MSFSIYAHLVFLREHQLVNSSPLHFSMSSLLSRLFCLSKPVFELFYKIKEFYFFEEIFAKSVLHSLDSFAELSTFDNCKNLCKLDNMGMNLHPYFSSPKQGVFYILSTFHH